MDWSQKTRGAVVFEAVLLVALLGTIATLTNIHTQVALKKVQVAQESQLAQTAPPPAPRDPQTGLSAGYDNKVSIDCGKGGSTGGKIQNTSTGQVDVLNPNCNGEIEYTDPITGRTVKIKGDQIQSIQNECAHGKASCDTALDSAGINHGEVRNLFEVRGAGLAASKSLTDAFNNAYSGNGLGAVPNDVQYAVAAVRNGTATQSDLDLIQDSLQDLNISGRELEYDLERYTGANAHIEGIAEAVGVGNLSSLGDRINRDIFGGVADVATGYGENRDDLRIVGFSSSNEVDSYKNWNLTDSQKREIDAAYAAVDDADAAYDTCRAAGGTCDVLAGRAASAQTGLLQTLEKNGLAPGVERGIFFDYSPEGFPKLSVLNPGEQGGSSGAGRGVDAADDAAFREANASPQTALDAAKARLDAAKKAYDDCWYCVAGIGRGEYDTAKYEYDKLLYENGQMTGTSGVSPDGTLPKLSLLDVDGANTGSTGGNGSTVVRDPFDGEAQLGTDANTTGVVRRQGIESGVLPTSPEVEAGRETLGRLGFGQEIATSPTERTVKEGIVTTVSNGAQSGNGSSGNNGNGTPSPGQQPPGGNRTSTGAGTNNPLSNIMKSLGGAGNPLSMLQKLLGGLGGGKGKGGGSGGGSGSGSGAQANNSNACAQYPGTTLQEGRCSCPSGQSWDGKACTTSNPCATYAGTTYNQAANRCDCPSGQTYDGSKCVTQNPAATLKAELSCAPKTQDVGEPIALTWTCTDANASKGNTFDTENKPTGKKSITAKLPGETTGLSANVTHALTCSKDGVQQQSTCVTAIYKPYVVMVSTPSREVEKGKSVKLAWVSAAVEEENDSCTITSNKHSTFKQTGRTGLATTPAIQEDTVFTYSCKTKGGNTKKVEVPVKVK